MKKALLAAIAVISTVTVAHSADMPPVAQEDIAVAPEFDWSGVYVGGQVGFASVEADSELVADTGSGAIDFPVGTEFDNDADGVAGGGHVGFNWQTGSFVFGVEGSILAADLEETFFSTVGAADDEFTASIDLIATASARVGFAFDRAHIYAKGGYAGADVSLDYFDPGEADSGDDEWVHGFNVGAGVEYAVTDSIIIGVEYTFISLEGAELTVEDDLGEELDFESDIEIQTIAAKLSYKF